MGYGIEVKNKFDGSVIVDEKYVTYAYIGSAIPGGNAGSTMTGFGGTPYNWYIDVGPVTTRPLCMYELPAWNSNTNIVVGNQSNGIALVGSWLVAANTWRFGFVVPIGQGATIAHFFVRSTEFAAPAGGHGLTIWDKTGGLSFSDKNIPLWFASLGSGLTLSRFCDGVTGNPIVPVQDLINLPGVNALDFPAWSMGVAATGVTSNAALGHVWAYHKVYAWDATNSRLAANWVITHKTATAPNTPAVNEHNTLATSVSLDFAIADGGYYVPAGSR